MSEKIQFNNKKKKKGEYKNVLKFLSLKMYQNVKVLIQLFILSCYYEKVLFNYIYYN